MLESHWADFFGSGAMRVRVEKWRGGAAVRIPAAVMAAAEMRIDQEVDVRAGEGRIVIELDASRFCDLENMLDQVTPENLHDPLD